jgi:tellurium resistance protein TerD
MGVSLSKGGNVSLTKTVPGLKKILIGLGWDAKATEGAGFDLDASLFMLKADGKVRSDSDFIFYNNLKSADGSVEHAGDNITGTGEGDDEALKVDLERVPSDIIRLSVGVTIHEADIRKQNFGMVDSAFIRIVNQDNNQEITRYDLSEDASTETAMLFGEVYRLGGEWKFKALGQGFSGGLGPMAKNFGVNLSETTTISYNKKTIDKLLRSSKIADWLAGAEILSRNIVPNELLLIAFQGLSRCMKKVGTIDVEDERLIINALEHLRSSISPSQWLSTLVAEKSCLKNHINLFLPVANYPDEELRNLIASICSSPIDMQVREHLFLLLTNVKEDSIFTTSTPLLRNLGKLIAGSDKSVQLEHRNALSWLAARDEHQLLSYTQSIAESDSLLASGILVILAHNPSVYSKEVAINFLSDITALDKFAGALLEKDRVSAIISRIQETGLDSAINVILSESSKDRNNFAETISQSMSVRKALGQFLCRPGAYVGFFRFLVDPTFLSGIKKLFGDSDLGCIT